MNSQKNKNFKSSHTGYSDAKSDMVFLNGKIYTVDEQQPWAEAVAIKDGLFVAVGRSVDIQAYIDEQTQVVDLQGSFAMPGIYDMHTHPDLALAPRYSGYLRMV